MNIKQLIPLASAAAMFPMVLSAQIVWDGDTDNTFEDGTNWVGDVAPADDLVSNIAQFTAATVDLSTTRQVNGLDFAVGSTLSGTGSIEVGAGGITVSGNSNIDTAGLVLNSATSITLNGTLGISSALSGSGSLTVIAGTSTDFTMSGSASPVVDPDDSSNFTGDITFDGINATVSRYFMGGTSIGSKLSLLNGATLNATDHLQMGSRDVVISGGATINQFGSNNIYGLDGVISGSGGLTFGNVGGGNGDKVQLDGTANTYTGGTTIDGVDVHAASDGSLGEATGSITFDNGGKLVTSTNLLSRNIIVNAGGGALHSNGNIDVRNTVTGTGDLTLTGSDFNWYADGSARTGDTLVDGATVILRNGGVDALGSASNTITLDNGGTLHNRNNNPTINSNIVLGAGGGEMRVGWSNRRMIVNGEVSGVGALTIGNDSSNVRLLNSANSYSGGTVVLGKVNAVSGGFGTGAITLNSDVGGGGFVQNFEAAAVHTNDVIVGAGGGNLKAGWNANMEFQGVVSGSGALNIQGDSGTVIFSNVANTYSGAINLEAATSRLTVESLGAGATITGVAGAEFKFTGDAEFDGATAFAGDIIIGADGSVTGTGSLAGNLILEAGAKFAVTTGETLTVAGVVTLDSTFGVDDLTGISSLTADGSYTLIANATDFSHIENFGIGNAFDLGGGKSAYFENGSLVLVVVPETSTFALLAGALALGSVMMRRRRS
ncbi:MAG: beta strand repeat-containing protein [Opitutaceae bacterium]